MSDVRVEQDKRKWTDWYKPFYENTPGGKLEEAERWRQQNPNTPAPTVEPAEPAYGLDYLRQATIDAARGFNRESLNAIDWLGGVLGSEKRDVLAGDIMFPQQRPQLTDAEMAYGPGGDPSTNPRVLQFLQNREGRLAQNQMAAQQAAEEERRAGNPTFEEIMAGYQFDGSPYDQAADYMQERRAAQMRAIQDMYNEYAAETQANVDRIGDIYGGAQAGIGETYDSSTANIEQAYGSAQQQATDQLARLGIEEAAPAVVNPMALSQAETLSNLETGRAGSLGATEQFGATAGGFASDMATVAQQQALETQRGATDQLADQLFELEMQRAQAQAAYNPYQRAMQEMEARQAFDQFYNPTADPAERELALDLAKQQVENQMQYDMNLSRTVQGFMDKGATYDEALEMATNIITYNPYTQ